jgi:hypothetical protein
VERFAETIPYFRMRNLQLRGFYAMALSIRGQMREAGGFDPGHIVPLP